jgi:hypothetical protein
MQTKTPSRTKPKVFVPTPPKSLKETAVPLPQTGVLGSILTDLEIDGRSIKALQEFRYQLRYKLYDIAEHLATRCRRVALEAEGLIKPDPFGQEIAPRASIRKLRRSAALQWLSATLEGRFDSEFSRLLRHRWIPILLADYRDAHPAPFLIESFYNFAEGFLTAYLFDQPSESIVAEAWTLHALRQALDLQRRIFGFELRS